MFFWFFQPPSKFQKISPSPCADIHYQHHTHHFSLRSFQRKCVIILKARNCNLSKGMAILNAAIYGFVYITKRLPVLKSSGSASLKMTIFWPEICHSFFWYFSIISSQSTYLATKQKPQDGVVKVRMGMVTHTLINNYQRCAVSCEKRGDAKVCWKFNHLSGYVGELIEFRGN